jgi:hypothetical protein
MFVHELETAIGQLPGVRRVGWIQSGMNNFGEAKIADAAPMTDGFHDGSAVPRRREYDAAMISGGLFKPNIG